MNDYDVQMAETESLDARAGDYSRRYRDRQVLLRQYPGPDAKRFFFAGRVWGLRSQKTAVLPCDSLKVAGRTDAGL